VFRNAIKNGWPGKEPANLNTFHATKEFEAAERFLAKKGILLERETINGNKE
jgi:hypothetical protein